MFLFLMYNSPKKGDVMDFIKEITAANMKNLRVNADEFLALHNEGKAVLLDVREDFEYERWKINTGIHIPASRLPENLDKLPKDKIIITACPKKDRSNSSAMYLRSKGFDARYLTDGLTGLVERLSGGKAKDMKL